MRRAEKDIARSREMSGPSRGSTRGIDGEGSHATAYRQEKKNSAFEAALGIDRSKHEAGIAFDQELQHQMKLDRIKAREERERQEKKKERKERKRRKKAAKKEKKRRKKAEKKKKKEEKRRLRAEEKAKKKKQLEEQEAAAPQPPEEALLVARGQPVRHAPRLHLGHAHHRQEGPAGLRHRDGSGSHALLARAPRYSRPGGPSRTVRLSCVCVSTWAPCG